MSFNHKKAQRDTKTKLENIFCSVYPRARDLISQKAQSLCCLRDKLERDVKLVKNSGVNSTPPCDIIQEKQGEKVKDEFQSFQPSY